MGSHRIVVEGGYVLSMDPSIGELERGSVLIEGDRIVAVERELGPVDAEVIDADGGVILPGFVDTHRHTWQTSLRAICADWTLFDYTIGMRMTLSPRCTAHDVYVSLSCDIMSGNSGDMFSQLRMGLQFARCMDNDALNAARDDPQTLSYSVRDALGWATINGARALGMDARIGSLVPGKQADLIVVGPGNDRLNMFAPANPVGALVTQANASNVQTVLVAGRPAKREGRLVDVDFARIRGLVEESCEGLLARTLADGPILPEPRPSFADLGPALLPNLNVDPIAAG